ncbi:hypothetical protein PVAP13_3NG314232 [Panicum virgatum]|uniref:Uncharacterized protein n=1 Tax=Panicum virgatum TaxID=38727 RepID=A0A8T0UI66_PANVG|nr:hypothetical protein PVAP13_3NG314232 [Panicum virgatum]
MDGASWSTVAAGCNAMVQTCGLQYSSGNMAVMDFIVIHDPWLEETVSKDFGGFWEGMSTC